VVKEQTNVVPLNKAVMRATGTKQPTIVSIDSIMFTPSRVDNKNNLTRTQPVKVTKVAEPKVKVVKEKPVKVAKVTEPKVKVVKEKPVKVTKVTEPKVKVVKEKPVKVAKVTEPKVKVVKEKPVKVAKVTEPKVKAVKEKPVKVAKVTEPKVKVVKEKPIKTEKTRVAREFSTKTTDSGYKPVSYMTPVYKASIPQETPVYNSFETMQNRLPMTRKPFDNEF